jgi:hypothetical protein
VAAALAVLLITLDRESLESKAVILLLVRTHQQVAVKAQTILAMQLQTQVDQAVRLVYWMALVQRALVTHHQHHHRKEIIPVRPTIQIEQQVVAVVRQQ